LLFGVLESCSLQWDHGFLICQVNHEACVI